MKQLEPYLTKEYLQDFDPADYSKREIIDKETGTVKAVHYYTEGINAFKTYVEPNIDEFRALIKINDVIDPLMWLVNIEPKIGVNYSKYLRVKALYSKLKGNKNILQKIAVEYEKFGE